MQCFILLGIQHSGKTTAGQLLAERLKLLFFDIDILIEQECGKSCRELYAQEGRRAFKYAELNACRLFKAKIEKLSTQDHSKTRGIVCAAGGGICDNPKALSVLEQTGMCIYIHISEKEAFRRICEKAKKQGSFPAYIENKKPKTEAERKKLFHLVYERRTKKYREKFRLCLNADGLTPDQVCTAVATFSHPEQEDQPPQPPEQPQQPPEQEPPECSFSE